MTWNEFIATVFGFLTSVVSFLLFIGTIAVGGAMLIFKVGQPVVAYGLLIGGPVIVVLVFGTLALLIQNNRLLKQIADGQGKPATAQASEDRGEPRLRAER